MLTTVMAWIGGGVGIVVILVAGFFALGRFLTWMEP